MKPQGRLVLLEPLPESEIANQSPAGLWLPEAQASAHQRMAQGTIRACGPEVQDRMLLPGLRVLCAQRWQQAPALGGCWLVPEEDIIGIVFAEE